MDCLPWEGLLLVVSGSARADIDCLGSLREACILVGWKRGGLLELDLSVLGYELE